VRPAAGRERGLMDRPHTILSNLPKSELQLVADAQRELLRQRVRLGVSFDERSLQNFYRVKSELEKAN
jgi:hypothetical protein